jgi:prepilin-type processing-associated H-X9-DG protein
MRSCAVGRVYQDSSYIGKFDGVSNTLLLAESTELDDEWHNIDKEWRAGFVFFPPEPGTFQPPKPDVHPINARGTSADRFDRARPSSYHAGGVNVAFCDGHVRFVRETIEYRIYCALMTPNGAMAVEPGTTTPSPTVRQQPKIDADSY